MSVGDQTSVVNVSRGRQEGRRITTGRVDTPGRRQRVAMTDKGRMRRESTKNVGWFTKEKKGSSWQLFVASKGWQVEADRCSFV